MIGHLPSPAKAIQSPRITTPAARKMHSKLATPQKYILQTNPNHTATCAVTYRPHENASNRILATPTTGKHFACIVFVYSANQSLYSDFNGALLQLRK